MSSENEDRKTPNAFEEPDFSQIGTERGASAVDVGAGQGRQIREEGESKVLRADIQSLRAAIRTRDVLETASAASLRRLHGEDLVHVPQPAENRFSWEEERLQHGTD
jgi:hypothetical protein